jgi:hypothetical protein
VCHLCQSVNNHQYGVKELEGGKFVMKSIDIEDHGCLRIGNGCRSP